MKRYMIFAGEGYYPDGGWNDFVNDADDRNDAWDIMDFRLEELRKKTSSVWAHIVDTETKTIVERASK